MKTTKLLVSLALILALTFSLVSFAMAEETVEYPTYHYPLKGSEIRVTPLDENRCEADGGYAAHGQYLIRGNYLICYGECEEENAVSIIWDYMAGDADLEVLGGSASAFRIGEDNTLTKVNTYALALRGSQALFIHDEENPNEIMMISFYGGAAYEAVGPCLIADDVLYAYGEVTGGNESWGPMLWPSVVGAYSINVVDENDEDYDEEALNNTLTPLTLYWFADNENVVLILRGEDAPECAIINDSTAYGYGIFYATGAYSIESDTITLSGEATNPDATGATSVWQQRVGTYTLDEEEMTATRVE